MEASNEMTDSNDTPKSITADPVAAARRRWDSPEWDDPKKRRIYASFAARQVKNQNGGRPRLKAKQRCPRGSMSRKRAKSRNHRSTVADRTPFVQE